jgi:hypothetical protein
MSSDRYLTRKEAAVLLKINTNNLKHMSSKRFKGIKPPMKKVGCTTYYGPQNQLLAWWTNDLSFSPARDYKEEANKRREKNKSAKSEKSLKLVT